MKKSITINVYMQDGRVFKYEVSDSAVAREHAHRIITEGWRNVENGIMSYYPVHQVLKVSFEMEKLDVLAGKYHASSIDYPKMT
ncbi:MAG: hypothetical protein HOG49_28665 [Candidatus Scalindua sp.]|jgi:hypothetical protein|nr:hypothetical protein [Candidatus Scalindua sp.]